MISYKSPNYKRKMTKKQVRENLDALSSLYKKDFCSSKDEQDPIKDTEFYQERYQE